MNTAPTVPRHEIAAWRMLDGNEFVYPVVIDNDRLMKWNQVTWIDEGAATPEDEARYPKVVE